MQTVQGDAAALIAATLTQAEGALRGGKAAGSGSTGGKTSRAVITDAYAYYLTLVTTGEPPKRG